MKPFAAIIILATFSGVSAAEEPAAPPPSSAASLVHAPSFTPVCANYKTVMTAQKYPHRAAALGITDGSAVVRFTLTSDGQITEVKAVRMSHPIFAAAAVAAVKQLTCSGGFKQHTVHVPFAFKIEDDPQHPYKWLQ